MKDILGRKREINLIHKFLETTGSSLTYLRGRRRIGKSFLLKHVASTDKRIFYFVGARDETTRSTLKRFVEAWDNYTKESSLADVSTSRLNWEKVFGAISRYAENNKITLFFDEIQWIAKERSGFIGLLKAAWEDWKATGNVKIILCGSSNNFFFKKTGGEEEILRGLKTSAEIWLQPFSLSEVRRYYFPNWTEEQVALLYMMVGGVPYYLEQFRDTANFIRCINNTLFTQQTIFLDEMSEVLKLEFKSRGQEKAATVLSVLGVQGATQVKIIRETGLAQSTVTEILDKLLDYALVYKKIPMHEPSKSNEAGVKYYCKDYYLNLYFSVLRPMQHQIASNTDGLIFPYKCMSSNSCYYIPGYTGECFELLVTDVLSKRDLTLTISKKLGLQDPNYEVGTYWKSNVTQIDIIVEHSGDREVRIIECKWVGIDFKLTDALMDDVKNKQYPMTKGYSKSHYIISSQLWSEAEQKRAKEYNIKLLDLHDIFGE